MKAIVCETPEKFVLKEMERPMPQPGEALVRIRRIGICGTDLHAYRGRQPYFEYPRILGHELSGEIVELCEAGAAADAASAAAGAAPDVSRSGSGGALKPGDRVAIMPYMECSECAACRNGKTNCCERLEVIGVHRDGGMREYVTVPVTHLFPVNGISLDAAAIVECLGIGAHAVRRANVQPGEFALVIGAGPIGLGTMKLLRLAGARVIAMDMNRERLAFCRSWAPAEFVIDAADRPLERLRELTQGSLAGAVFDATGNVKSMESAFDYASFGGRVVYVSLVKEDITFRDPDFHRKEMTLLGSRNATPEDFRRVIRAIEVGQIDVEPFITHRADFDGMIGQFESWLKPETGVIKAMVEL